jgi:hypothetical protein
LYDALGDIVGIAQGFPTPSSLGVGQTTIFNLQIKPANLTEILNFIEFLLFFEARSVSSFFMLMMCFTTHIYMKMEITNQIFLIIIRNHISYDNINRRFNK